MALLDQLWGRRVWFLRNEDTGKTYQGQFQAENLNINISTNYSEQKSLGREHPIVQFLSGNSNKLTFNATLWNRDSVIGKADEDLEVLTSWIKIDSKLGRPPILSFWVGAGKVGMSQCIIRGISQQHRGPTFTGDIQGVVLSFSLEKYVGYSLEDIEPGETRYHRAKTRDYYELLCYREYGNPALGDIIRKRHPTKPNLQVAQIVKLPSHDAIKTERVEQKSIALMKAYSRKQTPQRSLRLAMFERTNRDYTSNIL